MLEPDSDRVFDEREAERKAERESRMESRPWVKTSVETNDVLMNALENERRDARTLTYYGGETRGYGHILCPRCAYWPCEC